MDVDEAIRVLKENKQLNAAPRTFPKLHEILGYSKDERAFEPLLDGLREGGDFIRATCALGLGYLGKREAIPYLLAAFRQDRGLYVRCDSALALGDLGAEEAIPFFLEVFANENINVQCRIASSLTRMGTEKAYQALLHLKELVENADNLHSYSDYLKSLVQEGINQLGINQTN